MDELIVTMSVISWNVFADWERKREGILERETMAERSGAESIAISGINWSKFFPIEGRNKTQRHTVLFADEREGKGTEERERESVDLCRKFNQVFSTVKLYRESIKNSFFSFQVSFAYFTRVIILVILL